MPGKLTLTTIGGPLRDKVFSFLEHDTFIFGRSPECHARLPDGDRTASRHHFVLELNPPQACIRDLGSLNGTFVNDRQIGRRAKGESPEDAARRVQPSVSLTSGDILRVGQTVFALRAEILLSCPECGASLGRYAEAGRPPKVPLLCEVCVDRTRVLDRPAVDEGGTRLRCRHCLRPASMGGLCSDCHAQGERDPVGFLLTGLRARIKADAPTPEATGTPGGLSGYALGRELGAGGMGRVVLGTRLADGATVAIKVMLAHVAVDESARQMFAREIETTRALRHPNVVEFLDSGSAGGAFYVVLEYCSDGSLADLRSARGGRLTLEEAGPLMMDALAGLAHAHRNGFVHRDIKPPNILLTRGPQRLVAKIADMGLSKSFAKAGLSGMTVTGGYAGSFPFMPVEQLTNYKFAKPSGDVWSLGATFYLLLTGQSPRSIRRGHDPVAEILRGEIVPIRERLRTIPVPVAEVIDRSLANAVTDRYPSAAEMRSALGQALGRA